MRLRELRKQLGISQAKLGKFCGLTKSTISYYENGKREPDLKTLKALAAAFGCSVDYLLGVDDGSFYVYSKEERELFSRIAYLEDDELNELSHFIDFLLVKREKEQQNK